MRDRKEKARPAGGTAERAERESHWTSGNSQSDSTTWNGPISRLLSHGRANAVPLRHITAMTKLDGRTVRAMIATERLTGVPILSDNSTGYYLPGNEGERESFIRSMRHRAREIERAANAIEKFSAQEETR